jgi:Xaa-Pro aminopeptidase
MKSSVSTHTPFADQTARQRLAAMAGQLSGHGLHAYLQPPEDEHLNEYLPDAKKRIEWLTGFTGENAPLLILPSRMMLFVDGRFHLQVDQEVDATVVEAIKLSDNRPDLTMGSVLAQQVTAHLMDTPFRVGYDPFVMTPSRLKRIQADLKTDSPEAPIDWCPITGNLIDAAWNREQPLLPGKPAFLLDTTITGRATDDKLIQIRKVMQTARATLLPLTRLDEIAWLFNLRGHDIAYNPVLEAYALLTPEEAWLFTNLAKIPAPMLETLARFGVQHAPYEHYLPFLNQMLHANPLPTVWVDSQALTMGTLQAVESVAAVQMTQPNPVYLAKAIKNPVEIAGMTSANHKASRAIIRHLTWAHAAFACGQALSEVDLRADLEAKYREEPGFCDLSFPTIPGLGANSAIIHYTHADPAQMAANGMFYLLDSGCQYAGGTTDTTRTTVFGDPEPEQVTLFTRVLQAHIACASARFPAGTTGTQLDAMCRRPLYQAKIDCPHGIGHGVGAFLNVHEGPNRINKQGQTVFEPGMVTSIEPGYYREGWGGIRLENLYVVVADTPNPQTPEIPWFRFEPLTWVPFERRLIAVEELTLEERNWLTAYHGHIWKQLSPDLSETEQAWLKHQCI